MKKLCLLLIFLFIKISAQTEIKGFVLSDENQAIPRANIILFNQKNEIETFVFSNKDGSFSISSKAMGKFRLQIGALGFFQKNINLEINSKSEKDLGNIVIETDNVKEIKEVSITKDNKLRIKKDTVEYIAERFSNGTEKNVEELLKKLPGITIESDGKIKFKNKDVSKVMVEGDDLFEQGYQTLTQNMPTSPVEKIQVLTNFSKNKLLKNIENTEQIAINLSLKEDAKSKWFGSTLLASTSYKEDMRQGKLNLMNFSKRRKVYLLINANNLGVNEMNGVQYLINPSSDTNSENIGANINTLSLLNLHQKNMMFEEKRTNFNNDFLSTFNYIYNFRNDWKLKFVTIYNKTENRNYVDSYYRFDYENVNFANTESKVWKQKNTNIIGKLELNKSFRNNSSLEIYSKNSSIQEDNDNQFLFNGLPNFQNGDNRLFSSENKLVYTKKIDSSQALVAVAKIIYQNRPYDFTDQNNVASIISNNENAKRINQTIDSEMLFGGAKLTYLKTYSEDNNLELYVADEFRRDFLSSEMEILDANNNVLSFDNQGFINNTDYHLNNFNFQIKRTKTFNKKWKFTGILNQQLLSSELNQDQETGFYINPNLNISYESRKVGSISLFAGRRFTATNITQLYNKYIYQGNRNFSKSDIGFQILPDYNLGLSYNVGDRMSEYLSISVFYSRSEKYISNNMIVNPEFSFNQNILVRNNNMFSANSEIRKYVRFLKSRISIFNNFTKSDYENSINYQPLIKSVFSSYKTGLEMKSGWTKKVNYELGYEWNFNRINSDVNTNSYLDQRGFLNIYYNFSSALKLQTNLDYFKFGNTAQKTTKFLDIKVDYNWKDYKIDFFIMANNLLNENSIQRYSVSNISESLFTQRMLPRNVVFGLRKSF